MKWLKRQYVKTSWNNSDDDVWIYLKMTQTIVCENDLKWLRGDSNVWACTNCFIFAMAHRSAQTTTALDYWSWKQARITDIQSTLMLLGMVSWLSSRSRRRHKSEKALWLLCQRLEGFLFFFKSRSQTKNSNKQKTNDQCMFFKLQNLRFQWFKFVMS